MRRTWKDVAASVLDVLAWAVVALLALAAVAVVALIPTVLWVVQGNPVPAIGSAAVLAVCWASAWLGGRR